MAALNCNESRSKIPAPVRSTNTRHVNRDHDKPAALSCEKLSENNNNLNPDFNRGSPKSLSSSESDHTLQFETPASSNPISPKNPNQSKLYHPESNSRGHPMENVTSNGNQDPNQSEACTFKSSQKISQSSKERTTDSFSEDFTESETDMDAPATFENVGRLFRFNSRQVPISSSTNQQPLHHLQGYMSSKTMPKWVSSGQGQMKQEYFCNVTHHHNLEDQLTNLQQKLYQFQFAEVK